MDDWNGLVLRWKIGTNFQKIPTIGIPWEKESYRLEKKICKHDVWKKEII